MSHGPCLTRNCGSHGAGGCQTESGDTDLSSTGTVCRMLSSNASRDHVLILQRLTESCCDILCSREVWWANPHIAKKPLLCQWSWHNEILLERYDLWTNAVYDIHASGPRGNLWMVRGTFTTNPHLPQLRFDGFKYYDMVALSSNRQSDILRTQSIYDFTNRTCRENSTAISARRSYRIG
jgi:hypothetical protein